MALSIGQGIQDWIDRHPGVDPISDETYLPPDYVFSATAIQVANSEGVTVHTIVGWDKVNGQVMEPGPGTLAVLAPPVDPLGGLVPDPTPPTPTPTPGPVNPATGQPADTTPLGIFTAELLNNLGLRQSDAAVSLVKAWANCEGGISHGNPLNITAALDGSWMWPGQTGFWNRLGTVGVVNFDSLVLAASATAHVIAQSNMAPLYQALLSEDPQQFVSALGQVPWGTSPACVAEKLGV